ncbi:MAG: DUF4410 domain-containing protein [Alphaproteobacteria bacterium]|jgi:hypothetical protein|nr:DUF4410 domain-containing protein [Alphaproteobacteria bacterium]
MRNSLASRWFRLAPVVTIVVLLGACTTTTITPELVRPAPEQNIDTVVVAELTSEDELLELYIPHLRQGLVARLREAEDFKEVIVGSASPAPPAAIVISGKLTEIDKGSTAARWIIGFGAGRAIARATFEIKDAGGAILARFESRKAYSGGAGIGGANLLDMDDLVRKLGEETANSLIRWSNGEPLEPPARKSQ